MSAGEKSGSGGFGSSLPGSDHEASDVLTRVPGLGDELLLLDAGVNRFQECIGEAVPAFLLAVEVREGCTHSGHRLLPIHDSMMPHGCGLSNATTMQPCVGRWLYAYRMLHRIELPDSLTRLLLEE